MMMQKFTCSKCGKRLWRKNARLIDGKVLCSPRMFAPLDALRDSRPAIVDTHPEGGDAKQAPSLMSGDGAGTAIAQPSAATLTKGEGAKP